MPIDPLHLLAYVEDDLAPAERPAVEAALAADPALRSLAEAMRADRAALRQTPPAEAPPRLTDPALEQLERLSLLDETPDVTRAPRRLRLTPLLAYSGLAAVLALAAAVVFISLRNGGGGDDGGAYAVAEGPSPRAEARRTATPAAVEAEADREPTDVPSLPGDRVERADAVPAEDAFDAEGRDAAADDDAPAMAPAPAALSPRAEGGDADARNARPVALGEVTLAAPSAARPQEQKQDGTRARDAALSDRAAEAAPTAAAPAAGPVTERYADRSSGNQTAVDPTGQAAESGLGMTVSHPIYPDLSWLLGPLPWVARPAEPARQLRGLKIEAPRGSLLMLDPPDDAPPPAP